MSWNLLIYKTGATPQESAPLGDIEAVTAAFSRAFPGLEWESRTVAALPVDRGFRIEFTEEDGMVRDGYTDGGFDHIAQLAALCKQQGWGIADAQEGEEVDLDDPHRWFEEHSG
jgi:hypothetical protein